MLGFRDLVHLQQLKGMQSSRYVKGVLFFNRKVCERDYFSVKNSIEKDRGLDLGAETSRIKLCRVSSPKAFYDDKSSSLSSR